MTEKNFFDIYFKSAVFTNKNEADQIKEREIRNIIENGKYIYKFISFDNNLSLNEKKLRSFYENKIWCSPYYVFFDNDPREFEINYNEDFLSKITGKSKEYLNIFIEKIKQLNCLTSFALTPTEHMWKEYANNGNGFCIKYELLNTDKFLLINYDNKDKYDFTEDIFESFKIMSNNSISIEDLNNYHFKRFAELPLVLKNNGENAEKDFRNENEIRLLEFTPDTYSPLCNPEAYKTNKQEFFGFNIPASQAGIKPIGIMIDLSMCKYREELLKEAKCKGYKVEFVCNL